MELPSRFIICHAAKGCQYHQVRPETEYDDENEEHVDVQKDIWDDLSLHTLPAMFIISLKLAFG
jgi:hypothetical protein